MTEHLAQHLVRHSDVSFAAHMVPKLCLDHAEGAFVVGALVIVTQELIPAKAVVV
jgi:hypothetical protein